MQPWRPGLARGDIQLALETVIADFHLPAVLPEALPQGRTKEDGQGGQNFVLAFLLSVHLHVRGLAATV